MRLARYGGEGNIQVIEKPDPIPGPGEVVVETAVSAICGSELHAYRGAAQDGMRRLAPSLLSVKGWIG